MSGAWLAGMIVGLVGSACFNFNLDYYVYLGESRSISADLGIPMHIITGQFATENGSKYLQQLCKHFGHKIDVEYSKTEGVCRFEMGDAILTADADGLTVRFELANAEHISGAKSVIDKHLRKFAFRESFADMSWSE